MGWNRHSAPCWSRDPAAGASGLRSACAGQPSGVDARRQSEEGREVRSMSALNSHTLTIKTPRVFVPLLSSARYKGIHGGRGSGKSHFLAEALVEQCVLERTDAVCIREIQKSLNQSVKKLIEYKIEQLGVGHLF